MTALAGPLSELAAVLTHWRLWWHLAVDDMWLRYRRTLLGPFWVTLLQAIVVWGIYLARDVFGSGTDGDYLRYLSLGVVLYGLIGTILSESPVLLTRASGLLLNYPVNPSVMVMRGVAGAFIGLAHGLPVLAVVAVVTGWTPPPGAVLALAGLACLCVAALGVALAFASLGARYRDLAAAGGALGSLLFILTPVLWVPTEAMEATPLLLLNPVHHLLETIRAPLLGAPVPPLALPVSVLFAGLCLAGGTALYAWQRRDMAYWL